MKYRPFVYRWLMLHLGHFFEYVGSYLDEVLASACYWQAREPGEE
jgi:hypothetical protein